MGFGKDPEIKFYSHHIILRVHTSNIDVGLIFWLVFVRSLHYKVILSPVFLSYTLWNEIPMYSLYLKSILLFPIYSIMLNLFYTFSYNPILLILFGCKRFSSFGPSGYFGWHHWHILIILRLCHWTFSCFLILQDTPGTSFYSLPQS